MVESVDGEAFPADKARTISQRMYYAGFLFLPLLWLVNVWLFWPDFVGGHDSVVKRYTKHSAVAFCVSSCLFLPWLLLYMIDGKDILGQAAWARIDATGLDLAAVGL